MKNIYFILLFSNFIFSQKNHNSKEIISNNFKEILKKKDTIYVLYTGANGQEMNKLESKDGFNGSHYFFHTNAVNCFTFSYSKNDIDIKREHEKFINAHKNEIIDMQFLKDIEKSWDLYHNVFFKKNVPKVVYLIDYTKMENKKIFLYPVQTSYYSTED